MSTKQILRCAIYTRKSSEEGLEQEFNSLHAQREACAAYISSQKHEGWQALKTHYDDGGFSGGNMERPALKQLLEDIKAGRIDVIVVYKVDRLSRSLHDFARMVDVFDKHNVSFVSVTQQFNTTTSMGRLTLNVLLSFAQFEREVTGERIRDKIAASKAKGMWMGGPVPFGYNAVEKKLVINKQEAEIVRTIFTRYLELGCVRLLQKELKEKGVRTKVRKWKDGRLFGGGFFGRGNLYFLLANSIYTGHAHHKEKLYAGQHEAIIDQALWDTVQQHIGANAVQHKSRSQETAFLTGKLFDDSGESLRPVHANRRGRRYPYYISRRLTTDTVDQVNDSWRLPGQEIERTIAQAVRTILNDHHAVTMALQGSGVASRHIPAILQAAHEIGNKSDNTEACIKFIERVDLRQDGIHLKLSLDSLMAVKTHHVPTITHDIPMRMKRRGVEMRLVIGNSSPARKDITLIRTTARAHGWFHELASGRVQSLAEIASREGIHKSDVTKRLSLAFLAPDLVEAIIEGQQPADLVTGKLVKHIELPPEWPEQKRVLGFA